MQFTYVMGTFFTKLRLIFTNSPPIITTIFPPLRDSLYIGHIKLSAEESQLFTLAVFQLVVVRNLQGVKMMDVRGW